jgi:hypothetical protein
MVFYLFFALTVSIRSWVLFPTLCGSINTKSMVWIVWECHPGGALRRPSRLCRSRWPPHRRPVAKRPGFTPRPMLSRNSLYLYSNSNPSLKLYTYYVSSSSSSSAYHSPLLDIGLSNNPPSRSIFGYSHPAQHYYVYILIIIFRYIKHFIIMCFIFFFIVCCSLLCWLNFLYCTSIGWLEEISFRDKPTIAINCDTFHVCCVF